MNEQFYYTVSWPTLCIKIDWDKLLRLRASAHTLLTCAKIPIEKVSAAFLSISNKSSSQDLYA